MGIAGTVARFRVYPYLSQDIHEDYRSLVSEGAAFFWRVLVFENTEHLSRFYSHLNGDCADDIRSACLPRAKLKLEEDTIIIQSPFFGWVLLNQAFSLGVGTVSHELLHAALFTHKACAGGDFYSHDSEELLCYSLGSLSRQVYDQLYSRNILGQTT